jgi:hypothetical protein
MNVSTWGEKERERENRAACLFRDLTRPEAIHIGGDGPHRPSLALPAGRGT